MLFATFQAPVKGEWYPPNKGIFDTKQ